jgi:hypothetical protein
MSPKNSPGAPVPKTECRGLLVCPRALSAMRSSNSIRARASACHAQTGLGRRLAPCGDDRTASDARTPTIAPQWRLSLANAIAAVSRPSKSAAASPGTDTIQAEPILQAPSDPPARTCVLRSRVDDWREVRRSDFEQLGHARIRIWERVQATPVDKSVYKMLKIRRQGAFVTY